MTMTSATGKQQILNLYQLTKRIIAKPSASAARL